MTGPWFDNETLMKTPFDAASNEKVSLEEVRHIADLSNLHLKADEELAMQRDLNAILNYVADLSMLDTTDVAPMAQVGEILETGRQQQEDSRAMLRQDVPVLSLPRDAVMQSAPETDGVFFKVPKVIER
jgi:aspartyl-tRNA(Asn)/glutamyl-tRNA(Gln) amidotransferase subunit C